MLGAASKVCLRVRFVIVLISLSGLMACAGHNTSSRLDNLEERATDQEIIKLRMDTVEARLLVFEEDLAIVKEYTIPRGARWVEAKTQKTASPKPAAAFQPKTVLQSPVSQPPVSQPPVLQSDAQVQSYHSQSQAAYSEPLSYPASSEPARSKPGAADLTPLQTAYAGDNIISLEKSVQEQEPAYSSPKVQPLDSSLKGLPQEFITGTRSYDQALALYYQRKYKEAQTAFASFSKDNPKSRLVPNALYWEGEAHYALKDYLAAILGFKKVVEQFPKHAKSADALFKIGMSYEKLKDQDNARFYWEILIDDFPRSTSAARAKKIINTFQRS